MAQDTREKRGRYIMKLHELLRDTGLVADAIDTDREITAITCDSRRIEKDCLFV